MCPVTLHGQKSVADQYILRAHNICDAAQKYSGIRKLCKDPSSECSGDRWRACRLGGRVPRGSSGFAQSLRGRAAASRPGAGEVAGTRGGVSTVAARSCCNPRLCGCHRPVGPPQHPPPKHLRVARCAAVPAAAPPDRPGHHRPRGAGSGGAERRCEGPAAAMSDIEVVLSMPHRSPSLGPPRSNQGARQGGEELRTQGRRLLSPRRPRGPGKQHHLRLSGKRFVSFPPATLPRPAGPCGQLRRRFMPLRGPGLELRPYRARSPLRGSRPCQRQSPAVRCRRQLLSLGRRLAAAAASRGSVTVHVCEVAVP